LLGNLDQLSLLSLRDRYKSSTSLLAGVKAGRVHFCRVAGNTCVIPYIAGDVPQLNDDFSSRAEFSFNFSF